MPVEEDDEVEGSLHGANTTLGALVEATDVEFIAAGEGCFII